MVPGSPRGATFTLGGRHFQVALDHNVSHRPSGQRTRRSGVYFSESVGIDYKPEFDWFDPVLDTDTPLFVDPFLIFKDRSAQWGSAHDELIAYFQSAFELLAQAYDRPADQRYKRVETIMTFPEPREVGLGYVSSGQDGAGTAKGFARRIVKAMAQAIERGLQDMNHFEELGLLVGGIAQDRVSDITCNILKPRIIQYTQHICREFGIDMKEADVPSASLDPIRLRRVSERHELPINPVNGHAVLLVPKRFLRELPTLNAKDWWDFSEPELRSDLNLHVSTTVDKEEILRLASLRAEQVRKWAEAREDVEGLPYDVDRDAAGLHNWVRQGRAIAAHSPLTYARVPTEGGLDAFIESIIRRFAHFVEEQGGWRLLWNDSNNHPKRETSIQLLFKGIVQAYCDAQQVTLDREVELGRGPVDFVISTSATERVLLEVKKVSSDKFVDGLELQLVSYVRSDGCRRGWYLGVQFYDSDSEVGKIARLSEVARRASDESGFSLRTAVIDATRKQSASKL